MSDRERLAKMMDPVGPHSWDAALQTAALLLARGVTLPPAPEPPALVTEALRNEIAAEFHVPQYMMPLPAANALVAAAIRRAVERKTDCQLADFVDTLRQCGYESKRIRAVVVGFFGIKEAP